MFDLPVDEVDSMQTIVVQDARPAIPTSEQSTAVPLALAVTPSYTTHSFTGPPSSVTPRGSLREEARNAAILAAFPAAAWIGLEPTLDIRANQSLIVSASTATTLTACSVLFGVALWLRLQRPVTPA